MRSVLSWRRSAALVTGLAAVVVPIACGGGGADEDTRPRVVVTTSILGDVVRKLVGRQPLDVEVIMAPGADPHEFAASARQAEAMAEADLLVVSGAGFEQGLRPVIDAARQSGTPTFVAADHVTLRPLGAEDGHDHDAEPADDDHAGEDPHFWTDPLTFADALPALAEALASLDGVDPERIEYYTDIYVHALELLDARIVDRLASIPPERRVLVTNHEALGYFAERYGFEVVGTVIPSSATSAQPSAADLERLAAVIEEHQVPAIFAETSQPTQLAETLAAEVDTPVEVVALYTESLGEQGGEAGTYIEMMELNADRIAEALT